MADKKIVGVIGAGRIGKIHTEDLVKFVPGVKVKAIADINLDDKIQAWATNLGIEVQTADASEIINDPEIEVVVICSSTDTHAQFIIDAANAKKDIFCEKPIDYDLSRINDALNAVKDNGVKLFIGFNRRFDHNFMRIRKAIEAGDIGTPHIIKITSRDPGPPPVSYIKVSGGLFFDMMIHDLDQCRYQMGGEEVEEVTAKGAVLVDPAIGEAGDIDTAVVILKFVSGALGIIDNSRKAVYGYDQRVEAFGSGGCAMSGNDYPNTIQFLNDKSVSRDLVLNFFLERYAGAYIEEMKLFFKALQDGTEMLATGEDGLKAVILAMACKKSLEENRSVKISEIVG